MARSPEEIETRLKEIGEQIAEFGPALQDTVKKNRNRCVRKDAAFTFSPEHYTFVYRAEDGKELEAGRRQAPARRPPDGQNGQGLQAARPRARRLTTGWRSRRSVKKNA
jgi:hypothetical protein